MNTTSSLTEGMIVREVDQEVLILDTVSNRIHQLNHTASIVWRMRRDGAAPEDIATSLAEDFAVDKTQALADVQTTLQRLESMHLLGDCP